MLTPEIHTRLKSVLETADLVKFAKMQPVAYENEQSLSDTYEIVRQTTRTQADLLKERRRSDDHSERRGICQAGVFLSFRPPAADAAVAMEDITGQTQQPDHIRDGTF